jgi:hypothetical protein
MSRANHAQFELAMGLETLERLDPTGAAAASARHEADELFARLGVIEIVPVPLPAVAGVRS